MMVQSVHRFLVEFTPDAPGEPVHEPVNEQPQEDASPLRAPDPPDFEAIAEEAYRRGCDEARAEAERDLERALTKAREEADDALASARAQWVLEESETLAARLTEGFSALEARLAEKTSRALRPFLKDAVREQAIAALCETISQLLRSRSATALEMAGPQDLLDAAVRRLEGYEGRIAIRVADERDIRVVCDETTIETQIALWAKSLGIDDT